MSEDICYTNPFIKEVIFKVDFPTPLSGISEGVSAAVSRVILQAFPIFEPQTLTTQEIAFSESSVSHSSQQEKQWIYHGREREKTIILQSNTLIMTLRKYVSYERAFSEFTSIINSLFQENRDCFASRIGVRYVNSIELKEENPFEWSEYINEGILGIVSFHEVNNLSRIFHVLEYNFDGQTLRFQFGMPNPDYPAIIKQKQFVLDLDSYFNGAYDLREINDCIFNCHQKIQELFEKSITDKTRELMR